MSSGAQPVFGMNSYSYTFDHTAETFLTKLAGRGYREFELMVYPGHMWPKAMTAADRKALRSHAEKLGARIVTLNMPNIDVNIAAASEAALPRSPGAHHRPGRRSRYAWRGDRPGQGQSPATHASRSVDRPLLPGPRAPGAAG